MLLDKELWNACEQKNLNSPKHIVNGCNKHTAKRKTETETKQKNKNKGELNEMLNKAGKLRLKI